MFEISASASFEASHYIEAEAGAVVPVDVRDASAFGRAHLPRAKNIPIEEIEGQADETREFFATCAQRGTLH